MRNMKHVMIGAAVALVGLSTATIASANINQYTGTWVNIDPNTRGVTRLVIRRVGNTVRLRVFGKCHPTDCNWGVVQAFAFGPSVSTNPLTQTRALLGRFAPAYARQTVIVERAGPNRLRAKVLTRFVDNSGRSDYTQTHIFRRASRPTITEDCVRFNPATTRVRRFGNDWKLVDGSHHMKSFGSLVAEARRALQIIRHYGLNRLCFVGRPGPSMEYWKRTNALPAGRFAGEDCVGMNPQAAQVRNVSGRWTIVEGSHLIKAFPNQSEARKGLEIMRYYHARFSCFVGRPNPSMTYLRR